MDKKLSMAVVGLIVMSIAIDVQADTFLGTVDTDWGTDGNWASETAPGATMTDGGYIDADAVFTSDDTPFTVTGTDFKVRGSTLSVQSGTMTVGIDYGFEVRENGTLEINGGTLEQTNGSFGLGGQSTWQTGTLNLKSGAINVSGIENFKIGVNNGYGQLNISGGTASFSKKPTFYGSNGSIDFSLDSTGSMDITGADLAYYEGIYSDGDLTRGGTQTGTFAEDFEVTGTTITAIPEPASLGLLAALGAALLFIRRKLRG